MKYIQSRAGRAVLTVCWIAFLFLSIQPIHSMAAENDKHISENSIWTDNLSIMGESAIYGRISYCNGGVHRNDSL